MTARSSSGAAAAPGAADDDEEGGSSKVIESLNGARGGGGGGGARPGCSCAAPAPAAWALTAGRPLAADNPVVRFVNKLSPPKWLFRTVACLVLAGQVITRMCRGARDDLHPAQAP